MQQLNLLREQNKGEERKLLLWKCGYALTSIVKELHNRNITMPYLRVRDVLFEGSNFVVSLNCLLEEALGLAEQPVSFLSYCYTMKNSKFFNRTRPIMSLISPDSEHSYEALMFWEVLLILFYIRKGEEYERLEQKHLAISGHEPNSQFIKICLDDEWPSKSLLQQNSYENLLEYFRKKLTEANELKEESARLFRLESTCTFLA